MKNWYIVQSHSSFENKVAGLIKEEADKAKIAEKFDQNVSKFCEIICQHFAIFWPTFVRTSEVRKMK